MRLSYSAQQIIIKPHFAVLMCWVVLSSTQCMGQDSNYPAKNAKVPNDSTKFHQLNGQFVDIQNVHKGIISETMGEHYPARTFHFHNDQGKEVKTIREDQFLSKNPVFSLPFPKNIDIDKGESYYKSLSNFDNKTSKEQPQVSISSKVKAFNMLKKYGLYVKNPETATEIVGGPAENVDVITPPSSSFLVHCETASIFYKFSTDTADEEGEVKGNSLLDCTYITVYNHMGEVVQDLLVPDKLIKAGWVSEDGKYLFCGYSVGHIWDEGTNTISTGFLMIDLQSKLSTPIEIPRFRDCAGYITGFFSDGFFQMQCEGVKFLYINPYTRNFYTDIYERKRVKNKKSLLYTSFMPFEGLKFDISQHPEQSY